MTEEAARGKICLSMITKDEKDNILRLLGSLIGHVDYWSITDTGSTDGTQDLIAGFLGPRVPEGTWAIGSAPFVNFEQARNAALDQALASPFQFEYILLADSDMEFVPGHPGWRGELGGEAAYMMLQFTGAFSYWNTRVVRRDCGARYIGVTHEYVDIKGASKKIAGARFRDHASGSSRPTKLPRDERLLRQGLADDPGNVRYMFYLARTLKEMAGDPRLTPEERQATYQEAIDWFTRRAEAGGWDEEVWNSLLEASRCLALAGRKAEYPAMALRAYSARPSRAEPLKDLASHYNAERQHAAAAMAAKQAMALPTPPDLLFVEGEAYGYGPATEFYIAANYLRALPAFEEGFKVAEDLASDPAAPAGVRDLARSNLAWYAGMLGELCPSFRERNFEFRAGEGWNPTNPSVFRRGDEIWMMQRNVDYRIRADGSYECAPGGVIGTRTFLIRLDRELEAMHSVEVRMPADLPEPATARAFSGLEDMRGWAADGQIYVTAVACELEADKRRQIVLSKVGLDGAMSDWAVVSPPLAHFRPRNEKNWMPFADGRLPNMFLYSTDPCVALDDRGRVVSGEPRRAARALDHLRGGSQLVPVSDNQMLAVTHEVTVVGGRRRYLHRFVLYKAEVEKGGGQMEVRPLLWTRPFHLTRHGGIEFVAGLCWHTDGERLVVSYGVEDGESHVGTVLAADVAKALVGGAQTVWPLHFWDPGPEKAGPGEEKEEAA
jgi:tetratricopeptide (TPR) repeat protein